MFRLFIVLFCLSSCSTLREDQSIHKKEHDIKDFIKKPNKKELKQTKQRKTAEKKEKLPKHFLTPISVSITEKTSLKEVFLALAQQAGVDLQLDPKINATAVYTATKQPFYDVIQNICSMANLRLERQGNTLRIEEDLPYSKNYSLQFLNLERNSSNRISTATDVFNSVNSGNKPTDFVDNGSNSEVKVHSENSFWKELEDNIKIILGSKDQTHYAIHKQGGILSINATQKQHKLLEEYLSTLKRVSSQQVLIEAKIVEVDLKNDFRSGINWQTLQKKYGVSLSANFAEMGSAFLDPNASNRPTVNIGGGGNTFTGLLKALEEFGTSKTLSSPRLTVMNNQIAVLKVAQNKVYFKLNYDKQYSTNNNFQNFNLSSDIQTIPIGLVMSVQPSIDEESEEVILCLRPTISKLSTSEADPAVDIALAQNNTATSNTRSWVPVVDVKEIDSVLRVKSGEIAILGGLMEIRSATSESGIPFVKNISFLKDLFENNASEDRVVELVILIKVSIVDQAEPDEADNRLLHTHINDPRAF